jgi:hypothetical protein
VKGNTERQLLVKRNTVRQILVKGTTVRQLLVKGTNARKRLANVLECDHQDASSDVQQNGHHLVRSLGCVVDALDTPI